MERAAAGMASSAQLRHGRGKRMRVGNSSSTGRQQHGQRSCPRRDKVPGSGAAACLLLLRVQADHAVGLGGAARRKEVEIHLPVAARGSR